jgi:hypothetical protein
MQARCEVVNLPTPESRILFIVDNSKLRKKNKTQTYKEIKGMHIVLDPEAERERNKHLKQFSVSPDLKERFKKGKDSTLDDKDYYEKLYNEGIITDNDIFQSAEYRKVCKADKRETTQKIADFLGLNDTNVVALGKTNVIKLTKIGDLAYVNGDKVGIDTMERLDYDTWSLNNGFNVYKLREYQDYFNKDSEIYKELDEKINNVLKATKNHDKNVKEGIVTDEEVKKYQIIIDEIAQKEKKKKKVKGLFSVILLEPEENTEIGDIKAGDIKASPNSALFVISNPENFGQCIILMNKLKYSIQKYYPFNSTSDVIHKESILILGTKYFEFPNSESRPYISRDEIYNAIEELYPNQSYHEVPSKNSPKDVPEGWEIPFGETLSKKE